VYPDISIITKHLIKSTKQAVTCTMNQLENW
jgi:hypothetical protein